VVPGRLPVAIFNPVSALIVELFPALGLPVNMMYCSGMMCIESGGYC